VPSLVRKRANEPPKTEIENAADADNLLDASCEAQNQIHGPRSNGEKGMSEILLIAWSHRNLVRI
jgi:hypothetical protein